ncbi:MAG: hypothetical protein H7334_15425 [Ferruginibacter sp.]|nr:hypothetical protein [Ferruginibacter sp.]
MTQTIDLNKMGLAPMSIWEMEDTDGGGFWDKIVTYFIEGAIDHWDDLKAGFKAGY